jgi:pSer/pThr/pTyr-binding forkhead associated (FHA) protein
LSVRTRHTESQASALAREIDCVIGMTSAVGDQAARVFSVAFYQALAYGRSVRTAFDLGKAKLAAHGLPDQDLPRLHVRAGVEVAALILMGIDPSRDLPGSGKLAGPNSAPPGRHLILSLSSSASKIHCHFRTTVCIGRASDCDVALDGAPQDVSNRHACVIYHETRGIYEIADLGSGNGTFVNDRRAEVNRPLELRAGDEIRLGPWLRFLFRHEGGQGADACAALVRLNAEGRDCACHVVAPRDRLVLGNGPGCVTRIPGPWLAEGDVVGSVEWTPEGIRFQRLGDGHAEETWLIQDGSELNLRDLTVYVHVPPRPADRAEFSTIRSEPARVPPGTAYPRLVTKPLPGERPPWIRRLDTVLGSFTLIAIALGLALITPGSSASLRDRWAHACGRMLEAGVGPGWSHTGKKKDWPPRRSIHLYLVADNERLEATEHAASRLLGDHPLIEDERPRLAPGRNWLEQARRRMKDDPGQPWLVVYYHEGLLSSDWRVEYYERFRPDSEPNFAHAENATLQSRYRTQLALGTVAILISLSLRTFALLLYRHRRHGEYEAWIVQKTQDDYQLKTLLNQARTLAGSGHDARAVVLINQILERRPSYSEAAELKRILFSNAGATRGTLIANPDRRRDESPVAPDFPTLFLKIHQTPYAYRAPCCFDRMTLGRQKRPVRDGEEAHDLDADQGNDLVIRVPGSDQLSLRISRRHLAIQRIDREFYVQDLSGGRSWLNGRRLLPGQPYPIVTGDRLSIAGVLLLEVWIHAALAGQVVGKVVQVQGTSRTTFEATIGDIVTELPR